MSNETAKKATNKPLIKRRFRDRSVKDRPHNLPEMISAINSGTLDNRTGVAKRLAALRSIIAQNPVESCLGVLRDSLALDLTIAQVVVAEVSRAGFEPLLPSGKLNPVLEIWRDLQKALVFTAQTLTRLEGQANPQKAVHGPNKGASVDISTIILETHDETE